MKKLLYTLIVMFAVAPVTMARNYHINIFNNNGGSLTVNKLSGTANAGELIKVFIHPESDLWTLHQMSITRQDTEEAIQFDPYYDPNYEAYSFTMPPSDVNITAIFTRSYYAVTVSEPAEEGMASVNVDHAAPGTEITVTIYPNDGFQTTGVQVVEDNTGNPINANAIDQNQYSFTIGTDDVTVTPLFEARDIIPISIGETEHGTLLTENSGYEGDVIYFYTEPDQGYDTDVVTVVAETDNSSSIPVDFTTVGENSFSFIMPDCRQVTVNATFKLADYYVFFDENMQHGSVSETISGQAHHHGDLVTLTVTPDEDYALNHLSITDEDGNDLEYTWVTMGELLTFNMPYGDVTVHATFRHTVYQIEILDSEHGTVTSDVSEARVGDTVTLTITPDMGCMLTGITVLAGYEIQGGGTPHAPIRSQNLWYPQEEIYVSSIDDTHFSFTLPDDFYDDIAPNYLESTKFRVSATFKDVGARVIWCEGNSTLYFDYDVAPKSEPQVGDTYDGQTITALWIGRMALPTFGMPFWNSTESRVAENVVFTPSFANARPATCYHWFYSFRNLENIEGLEYLNTSEVTDMTSMFENCWSLTTINVNNFDMSKVTSTTRMFFDCFTLTTIWCDNTWNVETSNAMFSYDTELVGAVSYWESGVSDGSMANPVTGYFTSSNPVTLVVNGDGTVQVPEIGFPGTTITIIPAPGQFSTLSSVTVTGNASGNEINVTADGSNYTFTMPGESVTVTVTFFTPDSIDAVLWTEDNSTLYFVRQPVSVLSSGTWDGHTITKVWLDRILNTGWGTPGWNEVKAEVTTVVFDSSFALVEPTSCYTWFNGFGNLTNITGLEYLNTSQVTNMNSMFLSCHSLVSIDVNSFDVSKVTNASAMFRACSNLTTIYCDNSWDIPTTVGMFAGSTQLVGAVPYDSNKTDGTMANPVTGYFKTNMLPTVIYCRQNVNGTNVLTMFMTCTDEPPVAEGTWEGQTVNQVWRGMYLLNMGTNYPGWYNDTFSSMIARYCTKVVIDESFARFKPTSFYKWFANMKYLSKIEGLEYLNTSEATNMNSMFRSCESLKELDLNTFDVSKVEDATMMLAWCKDMTTIYCKNSWDLTNATTNDMFLWSTKLVGAVAYDSNQVDGVMANPVTGYFTAEKPLPGDANEDGKVDVNDVTTVINHILGKNPSPFNFNNANANGDDSINVNDVTAIINIILGIM
ncbi:MAG: BspA family leucine-rich repeat surface protein [Muribaculaceae bacterium]|nr:BspA family leucine-rich repeat surface protein [Muribaculaceae bacterium]